MARLVASPDTVGAHPHRFRLHRAGVLNVWQYDEQVFHFADGRLLLRGANGAGKSKTLEMLLPFVLDGDKARLTASARHHTSLLWLMFDGVDATVRVGYVWVEFRRVDDEGRDETFSCAVGIRASRSAREARCWYLTVPTSIGEGGLVLDDGAGPLARDRCRDAVLAAGGEFFDAPRAYKEHVGRALFGLDRARYDELLRLLYWLRQPQVGEDIEPSRLAEILSVALPELDATVVRSVGETFDELAEFGERLSRRERASEAVTAALSVYADYARTVVRSRASAVLDCVTEARRRHRAVEQAAADLAAAESAVTAAERSAHEAERRSNAADARRGELERSPAAEAQRLLAERAQRVAQLDAEARRAAGRAADDARRAEVTAGQRDRSGQLAVDAVREVGTLGLRAGSDAAALGLVLGLEVPAALVEPHLESLGDDEPVTSALTSAAEGAEASRSTIGSAIAAVDVVGRALDEAEHAERLRAAADERQARAEGDEEREAQLAAQAAEAADAEEGRFAEALSQWRRDPRGVDLTVPDVDPESVGSFASSVHEAAAEHRAGRVDREAAARAALRRVGEDLQAAREERERIAAERDPSPPLPALPRHERTPDDGSPLWQLVDFRDDLDDAQRAGIEAALQAAGLLDALVRPDGSVLTGDRLDTVLPVGPAAGGSTTLTSVLRPAVPPESRVSEATVAAVLSRVAFDPAAVDDDRVDAAVGADGRWRLGPLAGRADKPAAQYVGAGARAAERERRLAEADRRVGELEDAHRSAARRAAEAEQARADFDAWLAALPGTTGLVRAWQALTERTATHERAQAAAARARDEAVAARAAASDAMRQLRTLADQSGLPTDRAGLTARKDALTSLLAALERLAERARHVVPVVAAWSQHAARAAEDAERAQDSASEATRASDEHDVASAQLRALRERLDATVQELNAAIESVRRELEEARAAAKAARQAKETATEHRGAARSALDDRQQRVEEHHAVVMAAISELAALNTVPGLLAAALERPMDDLEGAALGMAAGFSPGDAVPRDVVAVARQWSQLTGQPRDHNAVLQAHRDLAAGPAADAEPRVVDQGGILAVIGRDDAGEHPLPELASRLQAQVVAERELLTDRERRLFEEHLLGDLGDALRARRQEAAELVAAMNGLLERVTTSQGIRARLGWELRDDVPDDVRSAVALLDRPLGALLPDERQRLRDALHRLIETSRAENPELRYTEHLQQALDYRRWHTFRIRISRPENPGEWLPLTRRTPLSQGEQKVVCYLPLFAAAAAHFTSVAGAAPHAPRLVLLDDAFPKIDIRTHPLLFGLLVDFDLDFVITSERLWGDHATVPSLAIYETLRSPSERGIAQFRHVWDGQRLTAVGA